MRVVHQSRPVLDITTAAAMLDGHNDFRVARRMTPMLRSSGCAPTSEMYVGCALDVETTGLDPEKDRIIELSLARFWADASGKIVDVRRAHSWLEDPGRPLTSDIVSLTGLNDKMLAGRVMNEGEAACMIMDADFVVAHNASFDRGFVERRLPLTVGQPWACTVADVDWRELGFDGRGLGHLLGQMGWFHDAHRAEADVQALLHLLDYSLPDGTTVLTKLIAKASQASWIVAAADARSETRFALKGRGYRWSGDAKVWWREVGDDSLDAERAWLSAHIYGQRGRPTVRRIDWRERHSTAAIA